MAENLEKYIVLLMMVNTHIHVLYVVIKAGYINKIKFMEQYISKSALVVEIENRIKELQNLHKENEEKLDSIHKTAILLCIDECKVILSLLDSLEAKEADLNKEVCAYMDNEMRFLSDEV